MEDLYLGFVVMAAAEFGTLKGTLSLARGMSANQRNLLALAVVLSLVLYSHYLWNNTALANLLPYSNLIVLANWFPLFFIALAGIIARMDEISCPRRIALEALVCSAALFAAIHPLLGRAPRCGNRWTRDGECVQTTSYTCSAASAATLLRAHGIIASEEEMSQLCLTRNGTSWMGLYRGLKLKTEGTPWDVEVVECDLRDIHQFADRPMILDVGLPTTTSRYATMYREAGWVPGQKHSVVLLGFRDARTARVFDPAPNIGREDWNKSLLSTLWQGRAIRLVRRAPQPWQALLAAR